MERPRRRARRRAQPELALAGALHILASIRSVDPAELGAAAERLLAAGADGLHVDVADGLFVPELTVGPAVAGSLRARTGAPVDVHLMVVRPEEQLEAIAAAGVTRVSFHVEAAPYPWRTISRARRLGLEVGLAANPATPLAALAGPGAAADFVNLLTTEPDLEGERLLPGMVDRIAEARSLLPAHVRVEVDGGVDAASAGRLVDAGADELVVGRAITGAEDWPAAVEALRRAVGTGRRAPVPLS